MTKKVQTTAESSGLNRLTSGFDWATHRTLKFWGKLSGRILDPEVALGTR